MHDFKEMNGKFSTNPGNLQNTQDVEDRAKKGVAPGFKKLLPAE